jgi:hypothetical protein
MEFVVLIFELLPTALLYFHFVEVKETNDINLRILQQIMKQRFWIDIFLIEWPYGAAVT